MRLDAGQQLGEGLVRGDERVGLATVEAHGDAGKAIHPAEDRLPVEVGTVIVRTCRGLGAGASERRTCGNDAADAGRPEVAGEKERAEAAHRPPEQANARRHG